MRRNLNGERQPALVELCGSRSEDLGGSPELVALVGELEPSVGDYRDVLALLLEGVLTSNRSAKSQPASIRTSRSTGSSAWLRIVSCSQNPSPTARWRITERLGIDIHGASRRDEEEARVELLQIVGRQRGEPSTVDAQHPPGEKSRIEGEQPHRIKTETLRCRPARR